MIVPLTKGYVALIDDIDYPLLSQFKWHVREDKNKDGSIRTCYAQRTERRNGKAHSIGMHRDITGATRYDVMVDHRDGNGLNNQRHNLRRCSNRRNQYNRRPDFDSRSRYKGVTWRKQRSRWIAKLSLPDGSRKQIGAFTTELDAALAYDVAARKQYGDFAWVNFPSETTMSKSTNKYGQPTFTARLTTTATAEPSKKLLRQWEKLDKAAQKKHGKQYDALTEKEKSDVHYDLAIQRQKARKEREDRESDVEMRLNRGELGGEIG